MEFIIEPDVVYVLDKNEVLIAIFKKDDENTIINPRVVETQNKEATFTFSISQNNPKWQQIKNPENLYIVNDKVFSTNFDGCFTETINESNEDLVSVVAYERQKLLSRKFVRAWNSTTGFAAIDTFMVVILSNGNEELVNNGDFVSSLHEKGTSGYVLDALLFGTGWSTGICDVEGIFDFETDQVDIYENILKVQEIWGGILVFDSLNKKVHHRDETKWLPYNGYEVKYQKNMQSLEKLYNNKIVTKLCPLGEGGLNIKSVNDGSEWITNFEYTDSILEGIENNPDIYEPEQLKRWGERKLKDLCKPRKELTVQAVLLYQLEEYELETIGLNDIVDVINYQEIENDIEQLRVVGYEYGLWDKSDAVLELSDITLESTDIFKKNVQATNDINNGTLNSNKVVVYYNNGASLEQTLKQVDQTIIDTKSELTKADGEIKASVEQITNDVDSLNDNIIAQSQLISEFSVTVGKIQGRVEEVTKNSEELLNNLKMTSNELSLSISKVGGNNLIRNSAMRNYIIADDGSFIPKFWQKEVLASFIESDTPPEITEEEIQIQKDVYWYCTLSSGTYKENQMYRYSYEDEAWVESIVTRKALNENASLLSHTSASDFFTDGIRAAEKTISGRVIKFDGKDDYSVSHIFNITEPIAVNQNEEYLMMSYYVKNNIKSGIVAIGVMFVPENLTFTETLNSLYEPTFLITPDECKGLTKIEFKIKIPKKTDFIPVVVSNTTPENTDKIWLDTNILLPKKYTMLEGLIESDTPPEITEEDIEMQKDIYWYCTTNYENYEANKLYKYSYINQTWEESDKERYSWKILNTIMSLYDETTREVWTYRGIFGSYYKTNFDFDEIDIRNIYTGFTFYPSFTVYTGNEEPTPMRGLYWYDLHTDSSEQDTVKRAKYLNNQFMEWETLDNSILTYYDETLQKYTLPPKSAIGVLAPGYMIPLAGFYEVSDFKLEYNNIATLWTQYPGEVYAKNYKMDEDGFSIESGNNKMFIDEDEILATYKGLNIFQINKDLAYFNKVKINESLEIGIFIFKQQLINNENMLLLY